MSHFRKFGVCVVFLALFAGPDAAQAGRRGLYPLTLCGPGLAYFCPIRGYFDATPFHYNLAIYPGCIKWVRVKTPRGIRRQRVLVCG